MIEIPCSNYYYDFPFFLKCGIHFMSAKEEGGGLVSLFVDSALSWRL